MVLETVGVSMNLISVVAAAAIGLSLQPQEPPSLAGAWRVTFDAQAGRHSCQEWLILDSDGTGRMVSDMEITDLSWKTQTVDGGTDFIRSLTHRIARPDCGGRSLPDISAAPTRRAVLVEGADRLKFCGRYQSSTDVVEERQLCWATLERQNPDTWTGDSPSVEDISARYVATYDYQAIDPSLRGRPGCKTTWTLGADGVATLTSGESVVHARWRVTSDVDTGRPDSQQRTHWLTLRDQVGNGQPDCQGTALPAQLPPYRQHILTLNNGTFVASIPPIPQSSGVTVFTGPYYRLIRTPPLLPPYGSDRAE